MAISVTDRTDVTRVAVMVVSAIAAVTITAASLVSMPSSATHAAPLRYAQAFGQWAATHVWESSAER